ncbi:MAG: ATP-binding protein [Oceanospirillaceae bacterium]
MYPELEKSKIVVAWPEVESDVVISADLLRLEQVMVNLIANAMQAVALEAHPRIEVSQQLCGNSEVKIRVRDNGPGMNKQDIKHIFEPFFTTKKEGQGLGLGLSISQRIIEDLAGSLSAKNYQCEKEASASQVSGAQFTVLLHRG